MPAALPRGGDGEVDARIVKHPFRIPVVGPAGQSSI